MNNLPVGQKRALAILTLIVLAVVLVMLALIDLSAFFIVLILLVLGVCLLRVKKPEFFSIFSRKKKGDENSAPLPEEQKRSAFSAHIILLYQGGMTTQQISVDREEFSIGRSPSCSFVLSGNTDISRVHAYIRYNADTGRSTITDNNSSHGTKVNGESLIPGQPRTLHNGDLIQIEDRILTVQNKNY